MHSHSRHKVYKNNEEKKIITHIHKVIHARKWNERKKKWDTHTYKTLKQNNSLILFILHLCIFGLAKLENVILSLCSRTPSSCYMIFIIIVVIMRFKRRYHNVWIVNVNVCGCVAFYFFFVYRKHFVLRDFSKYI